MDIIDKLTGAAHECENEGLLGIAGTIREAMCDIELLRHKIVEQSLALSRVSEFRQDRAAGC